MKSEITPEELNKVLPYLMRDHKVLIVVVKDDEKLNELGDKIDSAILNKCSIVNVK